MCIVEVFFKTKFILLKLHNVYCIHLKQGFLWLELSMHLHDCVLFHAKTYVFKHLFLKENFV